MDRVDKEPAASSASFSFNRMEWAGAFGDLGTLIPFVVAYVTLLRVEPGGVLISFGLALVAVALVYRTPFPSRFSPRLAAALRQRHIQRVRQSHA